MVIQQCIPLDARSDWQAALTGIKYGFAHTWEHCYAMHLTTGLKTYLYCFEADGVRIVCPFAEREFRGTVDIVKPFGFCGFVGTGYHPELAPCWRQFAAQKGYVCGYLGLDPIGDSNFFGPDETHEYNSTFVLDLKLTYEALLANMGRKRRPEAKNWEQILPNLAREKSEVAEFFVSHYPGFMREKGATGYYRFSRDTLAFLSSLDNVLMVGVRGPETLVAAWLMAYTPYVGDWLLAVNLPEGRRYSAAIIWYGVHHLKLLNVPLLNLGGGIRENDGIASYKQRFGGKKIGMRCLKQIYAPEVYLQLCRQANADPNDGTGYFPPYQNQLDGWSAAT